MSCRCSVKGVVGRSDCRLGIGITISVWSSSSFGCREKETRIAGPVAAFLDHLERDRHSRPTTRNNRLAAIHSLFGYLALRHPEHAASIQRELAIAPKQTDRSLVTYLTEPEVDALLAACDQTTWTGRRDHAVFALAIQTGLRTSELAGLTRNDITLTGANVNSVGKGRTTNTAGADHERRPQGMAQEAPETSHRSAVPGHRRRAAQPRRDRTTPRPPGSPEIHPCGSSRVHNGPQNNVSARHGATNQRCSGYASPVLMNAAVTVLIGFVPGFCAPGRQGNSPCPGRAGPVRLVRTWRARAPAWCRRCRCVGSPCVRAYRPARRRSAPSPRVHPRCNRRCGPPRPRVGRTRSTP